MNLLYGLVDMQSFYASCEAATMPEFACTRKANDDGTDPALAVAGDPRRRSGIILAATPAAKAKGVTTAMRLGEALRLCPNLIVAKPHMQFYLETSVRIQQVVKTMFPLHEQFSVDEAFFAFPYPSKLFSDPVSAATELKQTIWDLFRIRCRIGLAPNKWMAKMANKQAKKAEGGVVWWSEQDVARTLHPLSVFEMWGLKRRAQTLHDEFGAKTIGDVAKIPLSSLRKRFGVWGDIIHRWSHGVDLSPINPNAFGVPLKGCSHRTTLPRDFYERDDIAVVILELLDEVTRRVRFAGQKGRRVGLGLTYGHMNGGFYKAKTLAFYSNEARELYPYLLQLLNQWWNEDPVRAVTVSLDMLEMSDTLQLSLFTDVKKERTMSEVYDEIRSRFGETSIMRAASLLPAGQLRDRSKKIGGHYL